MMPTNKMITVDVTTLELILEAVERIEARLEDLQEQNIELAERISNMSLPGSGFGYESVGEYEED
jgi:predicted ATP-grasp superfamily ATP-dependent carboligase